MANGRNVTYGRNGRRLTGRNTFSASADTSGLKQFLNQLDGSAKKAIRPAAQAGAQVIYDHIEVNVSTLGKVTGNLDKAIYQAFSPENSKNGERAEYHMSYNHKTAPHGHLIEFGWMQRYQAIYNSKTGQWVTLIRPEMVGKPKPGRRASTAEKDAYYVPRKGGPKQHVGRAVVRGAISSIPMAVQAAEDELIRRILAKG